MARWLWPTVQHSGHGPRPEQDGSYSLHRLTPDNRLAVIDLGSDKVYVYNVSDAGQLRTILLTMEAGFGPRHLVFSPDGQYAFLAENYRVRLRS